MPVAPMARSGLRPRRSTNRMATKVMPRLTRPTSTACQNAALDAAARLRENRRQIIKDGVDAGDLLEKCDRQRDEKNEAHSPAEKRFDADLRCFFRESSSGCCSIRPPASSSPRRLSAEFRGRAARRPWPNSQRGLSGTKNSRKKYRVAGTASMPSIQRQLFSPTLTRK